MAVSTVAQPGGSLPDTCLPTCVGGISSLRAVRDTGLHLSTVLGLFQTARSRTKRAKMRDHGLKSFDGGRTLVYSVVTTGSGVSPWSWWGVRIGDE